MKRWIPVLLIVPSLAACFAGETRLTDSEEYYAGRSVAANVLAKYKLYEDPDLVDYVATLGYSLIQVSDRPEIFNGYHFVIVDTPDLNAFTGPGGFIFITTGIIKECRNEEELAGVIAHEIGHACLKHPELEASRLKHKQETISGIKTLSDVAGTVLQSEELKQIGNAFAAVMDEFMEVSNKGFGKEEELAADGYGTQLLARRGYNPKGLRDLLARASRPAGDGWLCDSYPTPRERMARIDAVIASNNLSGKTDVGRTARFLAKTRKLRGK